MASLGDVFEEEGTIRWHRSTDTDAKTKEQKRETFEGRGKSGQHPKYGSHEQSVIERVTTSIRIRNCACFWKSDRLANVGRVVTEKVDIGR